MCIRDSLTICNNVSPALVLIKGKIINRKGKENIYLPANAIKTARIIDKIIVNDLMPFEIFLLEVLANQLSIK